MYPYRMVIYASGPASHHAHQRDVIIMRASLYARTADVMIPADRRETQPTNRWRRRAIMSRATKQMKKHAGRRRRRSARGISRPVWSPISYWSTLRSTCVIFGTNYTGKFWKDEAAEHSRNGWHLSSAPVSRYVRRQRQVRKVRQIAVFSRFSFLEISFCFRRSIFALFRVFLHFETKFHMIYDDTRMRVIE